MKLQFLPYKGVVGAEIRPLYFYKAFNMPIADARILSFGACNFSCPYCKRDGAFRNKDGSIITSVNASWEQIQNVVKDAISKGQVIRLSGGDPVVFPDVSLKIARLVKKLGGRLSMAHNGSSPSFAKMIATYLESAAIDLKGTKETLAMRAGIPEKLGPIMYKNSLMVQEILVNAGVLVDVRTPIFADTTLDDLRLLAADIVNAGDISRKFWTLRLYKPVTGCPWEAPRDKEAVIWMAKEIKKEYPLLKMGLRAHWEPSGFIYFQKCKSNRKGGKE